MAKPITPKEVVTAKLNSLPKEVIEQFNRAIAEAWDGSSATLKARNIAASIASALEITTDAVYKNGYLDVEEIYEKAGWKVVYDQPAYCETYEATFRFSKKRNQSDD